MARMHHRLSFAVAIVAGLPALASAQGAKFDAPLVSTQWLSEHLNDPSVVVVHLANARRDYLPGHIPGARFLWVQDIAPSTPELNTELPRLATLDSLLESLGVSDDSRVVVYAPTVDNVSRPDLTNALGFLELNRSVSYNHVNTRLGQDILSHCRRIGLRLSPAFIRMLQSHHELESA